MYVYVLKSKLNPNQFYVGSINNLKQRRKQHNDENVIATRSGRPWILHCRLFNYPPTNEFSLRWTIGGFILIVLGYGSGAFALGTLTHKKIKVWTSAIIYFVPFLLFRGLIFLGGFIDSGMKEALLENPGQMIIMPIISLTIILVAFITNQKVRIAPNVKAYQ